MIRRLVLGVAVSLLVMASGCGGDSTPGSDAGASTSEPTESPTSTAAATSSLEGSWHRAQTCAEMLAAFEAAGLAESHRGWLQGNFYGGQPGPKTGDPCASAQGPLEHDHSFTSGGGFASHDENGEEVDGGDFEEIDADTVSFPSHAEEFGYDGDILVDHAVNEDVVTFQVLVPNPCEGSCADAYAWALSAFASGPWQRGTVPG
jgi:hypothetical protein